MIYVVRHGETDLNKEGRLQGRNGLPLNKKGIQQAEDMKELLTRVPFNMVFSSPQERAVQTAEIASGRTAIIDPRLDVFDLGEADRLKKEEVKLAGAIPDPTIYKGIEDLNIYVTRIFDFMFQLEKKYNKFQGNILISGHRCTTGCIGAYFEGKIKISYAIPQIMENLKYIPLRRSYMFIVNVEGAIYKEGKWLLVRRSEQEEHGAGGLALVGGQVDQEGNSSDIFERTLIREIKEEVGIEVTNLQYVNSSTFVSDTGKPVVDIVFVCDHFLGEPYAKCMEEVDEVIWMTTEEILSGEEFPDYLKRNITQAEQIRTLTEQIK